MKVKQRFEISTWKSSSGKSLYASAAADAPIFIHSARKSDQLQ